MFSKKNIFIFGFVIVCLSAVSFGVYQYNQKQKLNSASHALETALHALKKQDSVLFQKHVNTTKMAESILTQVLEEDKTDTEEKGFWNTVKSLGNSLGERLAGYIKPELINSLNQQINTFVKEGKFSKKYDITNIYGRTPMLQKIWYDLAGDEFTFKGFADVMENEKTATANALFYRKDIDFSSSLTLQLEKVKDTWQVIGVKGLGQTLKQLDQMRIKMIESKNREIVEKINNSLVVQNVEKSSGVSQGEFGTKQVLLRLAFENTSEKEIASFHANITFKNVDGVTLRQVTIKDTDSIAVGDIVEKSWPMTINPLDKNDTFIFKATEGQLVIEPHINRLAFSDGEILEPLKLEK